MSSIQQNSLVASQRRRGLVVACALAGVGSLVFLRRDAVGPQPSQGSVAANLASTDVRQAEELGMRCSSRNATGVGLRGEYFKEERLRGAAWRVRTDKVVDFDATLDWSEGSDKPRSVRWGGWVKAPLSGAYRFHCDHPGARVIVAKTDFSIGAMPPAEGLSLMAGRFYPVDLQLDRIDDQAAGRIRLEWTPPHGARFLVAQALLFLPVL